ncbi:MAG: aminopeptidase [Gammaproteobacteria bacterium]|nr:aminopeptidase [Gammaproteobacteria bacterium]
MQLNYAQRLFPAVIVCGLLLCVSGCYYMQAARGQMEVMRKRVPINDVIAAEDTPPELADRLRLVREARQFSVQELALPDNDSYRSFADLERNFALWNVVAAPEFSLEPKQWCYPIVGCVSYRGYFDENKARQLGDRLQADGYDVVVGGVAAYSTLGRFSDPILNTMMHWEDVDLIAVMFHELAHQVIYIKDDTAFNESFATAVEEFGIERWLLSQGQQQQIAAYYERRDLQRKLMQLVDDARRNLESIYAAALDDEQRRHRKLQRLAELSSNAISAYESAGRPAPDWWTEDLNNARLASMTMYQGYLPAFRELLGRCNHELDCFYKQAEAVAELDKEQRQARLGVH